MEVDDPENRNPASELAKRRWEKTTSEQRSAVARELNEARWKGKSKAAKSAAAKKAAEARWGKKVAIK